MFFLLKVNFKNVNVEVIVFIIIVELDFMFFVIGILLCNKNLNELLFLCFFKIL